MRASELEESAADELKRKLPSLNKTDYSTIDHLMKRISKRFNISGKKLHDLFVSKYGETPDHWIKKYKNKLDEVGGRQYNPDGTTYCGASNKMPTLNDPNDIYNRAERVPYKDPAGVDSETDNSIKQIIQNGLNRLTDDQRKVLILRFWHDLTLQQIGDKFNLSRDRIRQIEAKGLRRLRDSARHNGYDPELLKPYITESEQEDLNNNPIVKKFLAWTAKKLNLEKMPKIEFSYNSEEAQKGHHTGRHNPETGEVWVYCANRNLVDILRTVFHELTHVRQSELNMIKPGDSYPGSPIEAEADVMAGKYIKIFGKAHPEIFQ
jgi:RNA polymerase sigma factor (sigma-70 family)